MAGFSAAPIAFLVDIMVNDICYNRVYTCIIICYKQCCVKLYKSRRVLDDTESDYFGLFAATSR